MATKTTNYDLWMPESTDNFSDFLEEFNENMGTIDENLGGGSGSSGHTIVDENGSDMPSEDKLQFAGNVTVTDDSQNGKTVVTIGGGGGGGFVETTTANYEALPDAQKLDPTKLYMLNDTPPTEIPVDFAECVSKKASRMSVDVVNDALVWTYSGSGGQVSANSFYPTAIPKEAEKLVISLSTGTAYNANTFAIGVGVRATYQDTSYVYSNQSDWLAIATYNQTNQNNVELEVDLSNVTDDSYLVIACFGWNVTFNSIVVKFGGTPQYQTSMRYKDVPYANGQGGGNNYFEGVYVDPSNVIVANTTFTSSMSYTATEDCYVGLYLVPINSGAEIKINNVLMFEEYGQSWVGAGNLLPLKKGQTLSVSSVDSGNSSYYVVYGVTQGTNGIYAPVVYSDTERKIGVHRDGKPLYQKSFYSASGISSHFSFAHNISDIDSIAKIEGILRADDDSVQIPISTDQDNIEIEVSPTHIELWINNAFLSLLGNGGYFITLRYTKTTDTTSGADWDLTGALIPRATLLWSGSFSGSGDISVPNLSDYLIIAIQNDVSTIMIGNQFTGSGALGQYQSGNPLQFAYRFGTSVANILKIDTYNRGIMYNGATTYDGSNWCTITKIYGLLKKPV